MIPDAATRVAASGMLPQERGDWQLNGSEREHAYDVEAESTNEVGGIAPRTTSLAGFGEGATSAGEDSRQPGASGERLSRCRTLSVVTRSVPHPAVIPGTGLAAQATYSARHDM